MGSKEMKAAAQGLCPGGTMFGQQVGIQQEMKLWAEAAPRLHGIPQADFPWEVLTDNFEVNKSKSF